MENKVIYLDESKWIDELRSTTAKYEALLDDVTEKLRLAPEGRLVVQRSKGQVQYSVQSREGRRYLGKDENQLAQMLAEKAYLLEVQRTLQKVLKRNRHIMGLSPFASLDEIYTKLPPERRDLVTPVMLYLPDHIQEWLSIPYEGKPFREDDPVYLAKNGLRVRSKSETDIVDILLEYEVPFKYECPLYLKGMGEIHPDFIVLNKRTGQLFIWEHFGKVGDWSYSNDMVKRIEAYHFNGYYEGKNLIYTLESSKMPFGKKDAKRMVEQYLL